MTSTTLLSKEFKPLFKWAFKRNRTIMIIFSILLGLGIILNVYEMGINEYYDEDAVQITLAFYEAGAAFFTFISALKTFSFLHNKRSVDMFGALPTNRTTMFVSHLAAGVSAIALPFSIGSVIIMGIATRSGESFKLGVFMILTSLLMIVAAYTFTALIAYCCGTVVDTAIVTIASNSIWCGMIALYFGFLSDMIPGYEFESMLFSPILPALAPYGFSVADLLYYLESGTATVITSIIWQLLFTVGIFLITIYVSKHRKAESSQNGFAFSWLPMVIKAGASIVAGGFIGFIAAKTANSGYTNMYIFAFWYVIIGFVAYFVLHLIFARGLKGKFIPQAIVFGSTSVAVLILVFSMTYGMGIDIYVPSANSLKSVYFDNDTYTTPENIERITQLHQLVADGVRSSTPYPYFLGSDSSEYEETTTYDYDYRDNSTYYRNGFDVTNEIEQAKKKYSYVNSAVFDFRYKKKLGFSVYRSYYISATGNDALYYDLDKMNELIKQIRSTEEYKTARFPEVFDKEERNNNMKITKATLNYKAYIDDDYDYTTLTYASLPTDEAFLDGFFEAYKKDLLSDDFSDTSEAKVGDEFMEIDIEYRETKYGIADTSSYVPSKTYSVKDSYKNTINYLEKANLTKVDVHSSPEESELYYTSYIDFGYSGEYYDLWKYIDDAALAWEYSSCEKAGVEDYSKWHEENYTAYLTNLKTVSKQLYDRYINEDRYFIPDYTNDYIKETGDYGDYFMLEDTIIEELRKYSDRYVQGTLTKDSEDDKASDSDKKNSQENVGTDSDTASDIDINTNSKADNETTSKAESSSANFSADSDTKPV